MVGITVPSLNEYQNKVWSLEIIYTFSEGEALNQRDLLRIFFLK